MERTVNITSNQKVTQADFNNLGTFPRESVDHLARDLGGFAGPRYTGLLVEQTGQSTVRVGSGRFHRGDGAIFRFYPDGGQTIDLLDHLPAVAKRIATIVAYGSTVDTALEPRTRLVDADTRETEGFEHLTESRRQGYVSFVLGQENATPSAPAIQSDYVAVAHVILTPAGIDSITQLTANRVKSIRENSEDIGKIDARLRAVGPQIDTLKSDISGLGTKLLTKADATFTYTLALDIARLKDLAELPDDYATYGADFFLTKDESDTDHADFNSRVEEGARFSAAGSATTHLELENPLEPRVTVTANMAMPKFTSDVRTSIVGNDTEYPLTNTTVESVEVKELTETRTVRRLQGSERVCTNAWQWRKGDYDPVSGVFTRANGETFVVVSDRGSVKAGLVDSEGNPLTHWVRIHRYTEETITENYFDRVVTTDNIAGSIAAQTVLNSQDGFMTGLNLYITRKASSGSVRVLITEVDRGANPKLDRVLAQHVVPVEDISIWPSPTPVDFKPIFLPKGKRYAIVLVSSNAHFVAQVSGNKFAQGAIKYRTDGSWTQGDANTDLAFETKFATFDSPEVTVQLAPLELAGGIDSIAVNADSIAPDGTRIEFEVRVGGQWRSLRDGMDREINILANRPSLVQFRAVFVGTTDVMPALGLGDGRSEVVLSRPADTNFVHVSTPRLMPAPVSQVEVRLRLENWDEGEHTATVSLLTGAAYDTTETADQVVSTPARDDPDARIIRAVFDVVGVEQFKIKIEGDVGASAEHFHVAERVDIAFTN